MKKQILLAGLCSAGLIVGCNQNTSQAETEAKSADSTHSAVLPATQQPAAAELDENILLMVNDQPITKVMYGLYFQERMRSIPNAQNSQEMQMSVLNELANVVIVAQDAEKQQMDQRPEVEATLALLKAKLLTQTAIQEYAKNHQPTDAEIQSLYDAEYAGKTSKEFKARHILVKEEDQAKTLIVQLDEGGDFAALAKEHSTGPTGKNGGDLGWFDSEQMVKPFTEALQAMEAGSYTKSPVKTQFGWHVILLEETRETPAAPLEEVKKEITTKLQQQALAKYMQDLRTQSTLKFNEKAGVKKVEGGDKKVEDEPKKVEAGDS